MKQNLTLENAINNFQDKTCNKNRNKTAFEYLDTVRKSRKGTALKSKMCSKGKKAKSG